MKLISLPLFALAATLPLAPLGAEETATSQNAEAQAKKWLDGLGDDGLVLKETSTDAALAGKYHKGPNSTAFQFSQAGWWLTISFKGQVTAGTSVEELRKRINFVALDKLPTPGLAIPGWEVKPRTPVSSFKKGIEILGLKDGALTFRVKTDFFALYGTDPKAMRLVPADAGAPKAAYFQIRKPFKLDLTLTAPFQPPAG